LNLKIQQTSLHKIGNCQSSIKMNVERELRDMKNSQLELMHIMKKIESQLSMMNMVKKIHENVQDMQDMFAKLEFKMKDNKPSFLSFAPSGKNGDEDSSCVSFDSSCKSYGNSNISPGNSLQQQKLNLILRLSELFTIRRTNLKLIFTSLELLYEIS